MELYQLVKLVHIISAAVLLGTGAGIAFFMLKAHFSGNEEVMVVTTQNVVLADWIFTTPAVVVQIITGIWLTSKLSIPFNSAWFVSVISLFVFVGMCWVPVVGIQIRIRNIIAEGGSRKDYLSLMKIWIGLGVPAFVAVLALYYLMVTKIGIGTYVFT